MRRTTMAAIAVLMVSLAAPSVSAAARPAPVKETVLKSGLNTPRHLVLGRAGLVVTEAGTGGPIGTSNCATGPATEGAGTSQYCTGSTGDIITIGPGDRSIPVLSGLPSVDEESSKR